MLIRKILTALALLFGLASSALAAAPSIDDFLADPVFGAPELSPSGKYLAYVVRKNGAETLAVRETAGGPATGLIVFPKDLHVSVDWIAWKGEDRILYSTTLLTEKRRGGTDDGELLSFRYGRAVFSVARAGGTSVMMFNDAHGVINRSYDLTHVLDMLRSDPTHILMLAPALNYGASVYKVDVTTGAAAIFEHGSSNTVGWFTDKSGAVIARFDRLGRSGMSVRGRDPDGKGWTEVWRVRSKDIDEAPDFEILGPTDKPGALFVLVAPKTAAEGETATIRKYDFNTRTMSDPIWSNPKYDVRSIIVDPEEKAFKGACYIAEVYQCDFADKEMDATFRGLRKFFDGSKVSVASQSDDGKQWVLETSGPKDPGTFYSFDWTAKKVDPLGALWPQLPETALGAMTHYDYAARDGKPLSGYLTMPPDSQVAPPLVVMPHGGPERRDSLQYDLYAAYLATRGYAVFQPNFRGSGGFGRSFAEAGYRQWGRRMQEDITDGVRSLIAEGRVDPTRICIVGASYGGYAALYGGAREPDLYKCVVSIAGPSDLLKMLRWEKSTSGADSDEYKYWVKLIGDPEADKAMLAEASPITYARSYKPPVLLLHGEYDNTVPPEQSKIMEGALKAAGANVRLVMVQEEGHSYWADSHEKLALTEIEAFLRVNIPPKQ